MSAWWKALTADAQGVPDELRVAFVATMFVYLALWVIWFAIGHASDWPQVITPFCAGAAGIAGAFGGSMSIRGKS